jgi:hypothetical protein
MHLAPRIRRIGLPLGLVALAVQAAVPLILAALLSAYAAPEVAPIFDAALCHHGEPGQAPTPRPACNTDCPLCAVLAATNAPVLAGAEGIAPPPLGEAPLSFAADAGTIAAPRFSHPYQSRAPPLA